jgi:hypothetical protein
MLLEDAKGILHGHFVPGERHHLGTGGDVGIVKGSPPEWRAGGRIGAHDEVPRGSKLAATIRASRSPLCHGT